MTAGTRLRAGIHRLRVLEQRNEDRIAPIHDIMLSIH